MIFFIWRKNVSFLRYLDFCVFVKSTNFKICTSSWTLNHNGSCTFAYFIWIISTIKIKLGQILVYLITNISNTFSVQHWRQETGSRPLYDLNEMAIYQDLSVYSSWYLPFLILPYSSFQKMKHWKLGIIGYWVIGASC